ncbi:MAG: hypothetical protein N3D77_05920 [Geminicoccaceae bacterium]|nr:hypothetical protein [Geminicoccaceae bacterium]
MLSALGIVPFPEVSARLGIVAAAAALSTIGGEVDRSMGSTIGFSGVVIAVPAAVRGWPRWPCILSAPALAVCVGSVGGLIVTRTGLPSFIRRDPGRPFRPARAHDRPNPRDHRPHPGGAAPGRGRTRVGGLCELVADDPLAWISTARVGTGSFRCLADPGRILKRPDGLPQLQGVAMSILWWLILSALASWISPRSRTGTGTFASGGDPHASRNVGVPVRQIEIGLFATIEVCATIFALVPTLSVGSADLLRGELEEVEASIASVIAGCLPTAG